MIYLNLAKQLEISLPAHVGCSHVRFNNIFAHFTIFRNYDWTKHSRLCHYNMRILGSTNSESVQFEYFNLNAPISGRELGHVGCFPRKLERR